MQAFQPTPQEKAYQFILLSIAVSVLLAAALLARYNLRRDRGDRRGAMRLAAFALSVELAIWVLSGHHTPTASQVRQMFEAISVSLLIAGAMWTGYIAIEPYVRRHWPQAIVSWTRLAAGGIQDPLVGRDILIGTAFGVAWACIWAASVLLDYSATGPSAAVLMTALAGPRQSVAAALGIFNGSVIQLFVSFFLLFFLRLLLRREWLTGLAFILLFTGLSAATTTTPLVDIPLGVLAWGTTYWAISRFGFITFVVGSYVNSLIVVMPFSADFSMWYSGVTVLVLLIVGGLAAYGMRTALSGHSIIADEFL